MDSDASAAVSCLNAGMDDRPGPRVRPWIGALLGGVVVLLALTGWLVVRGIGAAEALTGAARTADQLRSAIVSGDEHRYEVLATRLVEQTASASDLTSDPVWKAAEHLPWAGSGMRALGSLAAASETLAEGALPQLLSAAEDIDLGTLGVGGDQARGESASGARTVDLTAYPAVALHLERAGAAAERSAERSADIDPDAVTGPAQDAVAAGHAALTAAQRDVLALRGAARLLPGMLGLHEKRSYLLAVRTDGIGDGAAFETLVQIDATGGVLTSVVTESPRIYPALPTPLPDALVGVIEEGAGPAALGAVPALADAAPLLAAQWTARYGVTLDGVIAVDLAVLPALLAATGPISFPDYTAGSEEIMEVLTVTMPQEREDLIARTAVIAAAVDTAMDAALARAVPATLIAGLADAADAGLIQIWAAHPDEQALLAASDLAGR